METLRSHQMIFVAVLLGLAALAVACGREDVDSQLTDIRRWEDARVLPGDSLYVRLEGGRVDVRAAAARALGRIGNPAAAPALEAALREERRPQATAEIAFALGLLDAPSSAGPLLAQLSETASQAGSDPHMIGEIVLALGRIDEPGTTAELIPLLRHAQPHVREQTLESLALLADSSAVDAIIEATHDPLPSIAWRATYALEKVPHDGAVTRLRELTRHEEPLVRAYAARALGRMGPPTALPGVPSLAALLTGGESDPQVRVNAASSLGRLEDAGGVDGLVVALKDPVFHVRAAALQALEAIGEITDPRPLLEMRRDTSTMVRASAYGAIAVALPGEAYPYLREGIEDSSYHVAGRCLALLGASGDPRALETLVEWLDDEPRFRMRTRAAEGLGALGGPEAASALRGVLRDENWIVAAIAAGALGDLGDNLALAPLVEAYPHWVEKGNADVCQSILGALESLVEDEAFAGSGAIELLWEALDDDDVRLRLAARAALVIALPEAEHALLPSEDEIRADVRPAVRSPEQPPVVARSDARQLVLDTNRGRIVVDLLYDVAPQMVESFAALAERGFFQELSFHRVVPNFVIQGGDPLGTGWGDAGYLLRSEWSPLRYERGTVGIATSGKDTGSCQLFITHSPQPHLNARYTIFGRVVEGMEVVDQIQPDDSFSARVIRENGS